MSDDSDNGLIDGIAPKSVSHVSPTAAKTFRGWHKPRKQWMRRNQWIKEANTLIPQLRLDGRPLRYFSLPGEDMLDIRLLAELCKTRGLYLKCLGFDEAARDRSSQTEVNISINEISYIDKTSLIIPDNLSALKDTESQGFSYVNNHGPFDIINLDFCSAISCVDSPDNHQVLYNLCEYQINNTREKWLLFLTTRAEYEQINEQHLPYYLYCLKRNADKSSEFGERLRTISDWDISCYSNGVNIIDILASCRNSNFVRLFAVGFSKWLLQLLAGNQNGWIVEMLDSCWYRVEKNQAPDSFPNMLSLVFLFSPVNTSIQDNSGLVQSNQTASVDETSLAMKIINKIESFMDVDFLLDTNPDRWQDALDESAALLSAARYPEDQYRQWATQRRIRFKQD